MIIPCKPSEHSNDEFIVCPRSPVSVAQLRERMLRRAKVTEGSYSYRLIDELHAGIFARSLDLKADYEAFFAREYATFGEYLRRRTRLPAAVVGKLEEAFALSSGVYHYRPGYTYLADEYGLELLTRLLQDVPTEAGS